MLGGSIQDSQDSWTETIHHLDHILAPIFRQPTCAKLVHEWQSAMVCPSLWGAYNNTERGAWRAVCGGGLEW